MPYIDQYIGPAQFIVCTDCGALFHPGFVQLNGTPKDHTHNNDKEND